MKAFTLPVDGTHLPGGTGGYDGKMIITNVTPEELKMLQDYRREREQIAINEENEKSSNQKAVEEVKKAEQYYIEKRLSYNGTPIEKIIACCENRLHIIKEQREVIERTKLYLNGEV